MVYKLKPLELSFDFEDRLYELGDQINVRVTLTPSGDVNVREARVDLVCEERYSRQESGVRAGSLGAAGIQGGKLVSTTDYVPASSWVSQRTESYVHSSVVFLNDVTLSSGRPGTYDATLQIQSTPPAHLDSTSSPRGSRRASTRLQELMDFQVAGHGLGQYRSGTRPKEAAGGKAKAAPSAYRGEAHHVHPEED